VAALPEWKMMDQFTVDTMHSVMDLDATLGSHPIVVGVETPDQITEIFDSITYNKGASILRMIEGFVGEDVFRRGVSDYLKEMKYQNADSDDLLRNLRKHTDLDVSAIVNTWIRQKGYPVVSVARVGNEYHITQKRFLTDPNAEETEVSEFNYKWSIPITWFTNTYSEVKSVWFMNTQDKIVLPADNVNWIKINKDQIGYYRVNYETSMWESLTEALKADINIMSVLDRAHLLHDAFSLAQAQQIEYSTALKMTEFLSKEAEFVSWDVVSTKLKNIRNLLYNTDIATEFKSYVVSLVDSAYEKVNWNVDTDKHLEK
jgi:glutamyl aminopeptidase